MTSFEYRLRKRTFGGGLTPLYNEFDMIEVYYDDQGVIYGWCSAEVRGATSVEITETLSLMADAMLKPALLASDLPAGDEDHL